MAKRGLTLATCRGVLRGKRGGWALCIGAGTSVPAFPRWRDLALSLLEPALSSDAADRLLTELSANAAIEAARDRTGTDPAEFANSVAKHLYAAIADEFHGDSWRAVARSLAAESPGDLKLGTWQTFLRAIQSTYPQLTSIGLADVVLDSRAGVAPNAILSFNAEPLLYALINAKAAARAGREIVEIPRVMDKEIRLLSSRQVGRIPYFFCHGLLPVPSAPSRRVTSSTRTVVFSEGTYLQLSNTSYSWQAATFISVCSSAATVFVGMSMTDPNVRTWLAWMQDLRLRELREVGSAAEASTSHYWLRRRSPSSLEDRWLESSVSHLGVRLVWLDDWSEVEPALREMLLL